MAKDKKLCFVISPIGDPDTATRKRSDQVLKHIIRSAAESCGYEAKRADDIDEPGMITSQVIQHVVDDALVVADLTERNPNVFYELAIRHALKKPFIQIIQKGETIPFDVAGARTIYIDHTDLDRVDTAKQEIIKQIKALEKGEEEIETPISVSLDLQILRQSEKPEEQALGDLFEAVVAIRTSLSKVEARIGTKGEQGFLDEVQTELHMLRMRLDDYIEGSGMPGMRPGRFHPRMLREVLYINPQSTPGLEALIIASFFRDSMPWLYEMGVEVYREFRRGSSIELQKAVHEFQQAIMSAINNPMSHELFGRNMAMIIEEVRPILDRLLRSVSG